MKMYKTIDVGDIVECLDTYYIRNGTFSYVGKRFKVAKVLYPYVFDKEGHSYSYAKDRQPFIPTAQYSNDVILVRKNIKNHSRIDSKQR